MQPKRITYPLLFGPPILSAKDPASRPMDLRRVLAAAEPISRSRMPETLHPDLPPYPVLVGKNWIVDDIPANLYGRPIAIIGAGAAGLCAGYELMKCGLTPVFFESQMANATQARPGGRAYSWDFPNVGDGKKTVGELGCMRFPKSHDTLRTYVDNVFRGEYSYASPPATPRPDFQWPEFKDPLLIVQDGEDKKVVFDTDLYARGISKNRQSLRIKAGTTFDQLPEALRVVSNEFQANMSVVLSDVVAAYNKGDMDAIGGAWTTLNNQYQDRSIFEVLRKDWQWTEKPAGDGGATMMDIFGELGLGSGGFDAFWGTTFMEIVRIKLHQDETGQDAFLGGSSYMLKPFLSHAVACADSKVRKMADVTSSHVVTNPVARIINEGDEGKSGIRIDCEDGKGGYDIYRFPCVVLTASPAAISSSIYITENLLSPGAWNGIRSIPLTGCGKIFAAYDEPFWKGQGGAEDVVVTSVTDEAIRQIYTFDNYHWGSDSKAGVLMMSYTWGDWAHKMGSLSEEEQVRSAMRMLPSIVANGGANYEFIQKIGAAIDAKNIRAINWSHERGFAGGYRMADLNRHPDQIAMALAGSTPNDPKSALFLAGEACAWLGLSGWIEGALQTGINAALGVGDWIKNNGNNYDWDKQFTQVSGINGTSFQIPSDPGGIPYNPPVAGGN